MTVAYGRTVALSSLRLAVAPGTITAMIGPSGCGKTTALRAVAGFVKPTEGAIRIGGADVTGLPPHARDLGMVVQSYALFPHMRVEENVAFGPRARGQPKAEIATRVAECLRLVGMAAYAQRMPRELSGGQQQRVAIARALAIRPRVLLLDEPLSALDAQIRRSMLDELALLHKALPSLTALYVTHDQGEALALANRIAILRDGRLIAEDSAQALYRSPPNRFAAEFLGNANLLPVEVQSGAGGDGYARVRLGAQTMLARAPGRDLGRKALLCVRPHHVAFRPTPGAAQNLLAGTITAARWQGELHHVEVDVQGETMRLLETSLRAVPERGTAVTLHFAAEDATLLAQDG